MLVLDAWLSIRQQEVIQVARVPVDGLTGGPGGGKTTLKRELRAEDLYIKH
jgi:predicted ATPase